MDENIPARDADGQPLYARLAETLRDRIRSGHYPPGHRLPTEAELGASSGLSRITVRQALALLTREGLIERFARRGTFVTDRLGPGSWALRSINDVVRIGADMRTQVLDWRSVAPPPEMQQLFGSADPLWRLRAVRLQGDMPLYFVENYQRADIGVQLSVPDLEAHTMAELICHKLRIPVSHATEDICVGHTTPMIARRLWTDAGQPVIVQQIDIYGTDNRLIQSGSGWWRNDRLRRRFAFSLP